MLDIKLIREKTDFVRERLATRNAGDEKKLDEILALDEQRRKILNEVEQLKATRNRVSKEIGALMGQKKTAEAEAKKTETRQIGDKISELDKQVAEVEPKLEAILLQIPNLPNEKVKIGKTSEDNPEVRVWGHKGADRFQAEDARRNHREAEDDRFRARDENFRQRIYSLYQLGRSPRTRVDPVPARPAHH